MHFYWFEGRHDLRASIEKEPEEGKLIRWLFWARKGMERGTEQGGRQMAMACGALGLGGRAETR